MRLRDKSEIKHVQIGVKVNSKEDIFRKLLELYDSRADFFLKKWQRLLPLNEMVIDRWEKAKKLGFGEKANIYDSALVFGDVKVGKHTWIGPFTIIDGSGGGLVIGDYCSISVGVQIYTHDSVKWSVSGGKIKQEKASTRIGNCTYIGPLSVITKGVKVGDHCVIGAFSYVDKKIPAFSIARGQPAKVIGRVVLRKNGEVDYLYFDEYIEGNTEKV
jgi:acetyltransferase-like isoleucine patch superfamily enzyme